MYVQGPCSQPHHPVAHCTVQTLFVCLFFSACQLNLQSYKYQLEVATPTTADKCLCLLQLSYPIPVQSSGRQHTQTQLWAILTRPVLGRADKLSEVEFKLIRQAINPDPQLTNNQENHSKMDLQRFPPSTPFASFWDRSNYICLIPGVCLISSWILPMTDLSPYPESCFRTSLLPSSEDSFEYLIWT